MLQGIEKSLGSVTQISLRQKLATGAFFVPQKVTAMFTSEQITGILDSAAKKLSELEGEQPADTTVAGANYSQALSLMAVARVLINISEQLSEEKVNPLFCPRCELQMATEWELKKHNWNIHGVEPDNVSFGKPSQASILDDKDFDDPLSPEEELQELKGQLEANEVIRDKMIERGMSDSSEFGRMRIKIALLEAKIDLLSANIKHPNPPLFEAAMSKIAKNFEEIFMQDLNRRFRISDGTRDDEDAKKPEDILS